MTGRVLSSYRHDVQVYAPSIGTSLNWHLIGSVVLSGLIGCMGLAAVVIALGAASL